MNAIEYIQQNINPRVILEYYNFRQITETNNSFRACCEIHKGNNPKAFVWNKLNNLWFCYTGDCHGGDVFNLVQKIENVTFQKAVERVAQILGLDIKGMKVNSSPNRIAIEQKQWLEKQKNKLNTKVIDGEFKLPYTKFTNNIEGFTRFDTKIIENFNSKFCKVFPTEEFALYDKLVIPIEKNSKCVGVALRDTSGNSKAKWFYYPVGLKINEILYNLDKVKEMLETNDTDEVILVEGIFDVWAYHRIGIDNVVATFGSSLKEEQYKELIRLGVNITLSFDNDTAGNKCTIETAKKFKNKTIVKKITLPPSKDPADVKEEELLEAYLKRTRYVQE